MRGIIEMACNRCITNDPSHFPHPTPKGKRYLKGTWHGSGVQGASLLLGLIPARHLALGSTRLLLGLIVAACNSQVPHGSPNSKLTSSTLLPCSISLQKPSKGNILFKWLRYPPFPFCWPQNCPQQKGGGKIPNLTNPNWFVNGRGL